MSVRYSFFVHRTVPRWRLVIPKAGSFPERTTADGSRPTAPAHRYARRGPQGENPELVPKDASSGGSPEADAAPARPPKPGKAFTRQRN